MDLILETLNQYPIFRDFVLLMGTLRFIFKPLVTFVDRFVHYTPWKSDDAKWQAVKGTRGYSILAFLIDYFASVKIK